MHIVIIIILTMKTLTWVTVTGVQVILADREMAVLGYLLSVCK